MNTAAARPNAVPSATARTEVYSVPQISPRIPYRSVFGSHTRPDRNPKPWRWTAGAAEYAICSTMKATSPIVRTVKPKQTARNTRSTTVCRPLGARAISPARDSNNSPDESVIRGAATPVDMFASASYGVPRCWTASVAFATTPAGSGM